MLQQIGSWCQEKTPDTTVYLVLSGLMAVGDVRSYDLTFTERRWLWILVTIPGIVVSGSNSQHHPKFIEHQSIILVIKLR